MLTGVRYAVGLVLAASGASSSADGEVFAGPVAGGIDLHLDTAADGFRAGVDSEGENLLGLEPRGENGGFRAAVGHVQVYRAGLEIRYSFFRVRIHEPAGRRLEIQHCVGVGGYECLVYPQTYA